MFTNICSFLPKRELLTNLISSSGSNILVITETWLNDNVSDAEILTDLPEFRVYRSDRKGTRGGGVLIAIHQGITCSIVHVTSDIESLWLICHAPPVTVLLGVCYRPPQTNSDFCRHMNNSLRQLVATYPNARILLFGDFNYPDIEWHNLGLSSLTCHAEAKNFIDVCLNFNFSQLVTEPTRVTQETANILDLILTNSPENLSSISYLPEISDHKIIHAQFSFISAPKFTSAKTIRLYDRGNYDAINEDLDTFLSEYKSVFHTRTIHENWSIFKNKLNVLINMFIPRVTFRTNNNKPWFSVHLT